VLKCYNSTIWNKWNRMVKWIVVESHNAICLCLLIPVCVYVYIFINIYIMCIYIHECMSYDLWKYIDKCHNVEQIKPDRRVHTIWFIYMKFKTGQNTCMV
jgi:hypothetical protein